MEKNFVLIYQFIQVQEALLFLLKILQNKKKSKKNSEKAKKDLDWHKKQQKLEVGIGIYKQGN
jgi:hypothetical protein